MTMPSRTAVSPPAGGCATSNEVARTTESGVPPVGGRGLWPTFRHTESIKETSEMTRRRVTATVRCAKPECTDTAYFEYDSQRDRQEGDRWRKDHPWRCYRHRNEDEVLSPTNLERTTVLTASKSEFGGGVLPGLFWRAEGASSASGRISGPGFKAIASDLPEGARLIVTARIELPDSPSQ